LSCLNNRQGLKIRAIGQIPSGYEDYAAKTLPRLESLGVEVILNRGAEDVSGMLCRTRVAFLPFPDGMSRRRSSAIAAMGNGALLVTRASEAEKEFFTTICAMPKAGSDFSGLLSNVLEDYDSYESIRRAGQEFAQSLSWGSVARGYVQVFDKLVELKNE